MKNFLINYLANNTTSLLVKVLFSVILIAVVLSFFSIITATAILFFIFLFSLTLALILKCNIGKRELFILLSIGFLIHFSLISFIYVTGFNPVGGGADYQGYHSMGKEIAGRIWAGNFSLEGVRGGHDFTLLVGVAYALFYPDILVGNVLVLWFFCLSLIFSYMIIMEMGCSRKVAFLAGLLILLYPSYLYFGSLLLKDTLVIPLVLFAMLLCVKILKEFSWIRLLLLFITLIPIIHLRFYIGYAVMFGFLASWFLVSNFKRKWLYGFYIFFLLGFSPLILGNGYHGMDVLVEFINPEQITIYREIAYNPNSPNNENLDPIQPGQPLPQNSDPISGGTETPSEDVPSGFGSSFVVETGLSRGPLAFTINSSLSFAYALLGPFPWQLRYGRQNVALFETIPWYIILVMFGYCFFRAVKEKYILYLISQKKRVIALILFSVLALAGLSLFINNYGIIMRIRIPMVIMLIIAGCVVFDDYLENYLRKIPWLKNI